MNWLLAANVLFFLGGICLTVGTLINLLRQLGVLR